MKLAVIKITVSKENSYEPTDDELEAICEEIDLIIEPHLNSIKDKLQIMGLKMVVSE